MRKVIAYIASDFKKDKIWLRRTKPHKRNYQDYITKSTGKNLFDKNNINGLNVYLDTTNNKLVSNNNNKSIYISCKPNTTYTISKTPSKRFGVAYTYTTPTKNTAIYGTITNYDGTSITITTDTNAQYLVVWVINSNISGEISYQTAIDTLQIEYGNQSTPYEPYGTGWYVKKEMGKVVLNGSESWLVQGSSANYYEYRINNGVEISGTNIQNEVKTNYFNQTTNSRVMINNAKTIYLRFPTSSGVDISTLELFLILYPTLTLVISISIVEDASFIVTISGSSYTFLFISLYSLNSFFSWLALTIFITSL